MNTNKYKVPFVITGSLLVEDDVWGSDKQSMLTEMEQIKDNLKCISEDVNIQLNFPQIVTPPEEASLK